MPRLKFQTAKSIYKPLEIEIDEKVYCCKKLTKDFLKEFLSFEQKALEGDLEAPYKQANFAFGIPLKILYQLDGPEIRDINQVVLGAILNPEKADASDEKDPNLKSPGDKK